MGCKLSGIEVGCVSKKMQDRKRFVGGGGLGGGADRAVGIAGGSDKCRFVADELGFDACIDHRAIDFAQRLAAACPNGIDVYFENVGGAVQGKNFGKLLVRWRAEQGSID
jgi:hypothetical protein